MIEDVTNRPVILFACVHNSGRSVAAKVLAEEYGAGRVEVRSAGSEPGDRVNPAVAQVLAERGLDTSRHVPSLLTYDSVESSDVVVTMGCGETCPVFPGKRYEDWQIDDPEGQDVETVRGIVDDVDRRVCKLIDELLTQEPLARQTGLRGGEQLPASRHSLEVVDAAIFQDCPRAGD